MTPSLRINRLPEDLQRIAEQIDGDEVPGRAVADLHKGSISTAEIDWALQSGRFTETQQGELHRLQAYVRDNVTETGPTPALPQVTGSGVEIDPTNPRHFAYLIRLESFSLRETGDSETAFWGAFDHKDPAGDLRITVNDKKIAGEVSAADGETVSAPAMTFILPSEDIDYDAGKVNVRIGFTDQDPGGTDELPGFSQSIDFAEITEGPATFNVSETSSDAVNVVVERVPLNMIPAELSQQHQGDLAAAYSAQRQLIAAAQDIARSSSRSGGDEMDAAIDAARETSAPFNWPAVELQESGLRTAAHLSRLREAVLAIHPGMPERRALVASFNEKVQQFADARTYPGSSSYVPAPTVSGLFIDNPMRSAERQRGAVLTHTRAALDRLEKIATPYKYRQGDGPTLADLNAAHDHIVEVSLMRPPPPDAAELRSRFNEVVSGFRAAVINKDNRVSSFAEYWGNAKPRGNPTDRDYTFADSVTNLFVSANRGEQQQRLVETAELLLAQVDEIPQRAYRDQNAHTYIRFRAEATRSVGAILSLGMDPNHPSFRNLSGAFSQLLHQGTSEFITGTAGVDESQRVFSDPSFYARGGPAYDGLEFSLNPTLDEMR